MQYKYTCIDKNIFDIMILNNLVFLNDLAGRFVRNEEDKKDIVQDTVYRAIKNREKFRPGSNIRGWLTTMMKNIFISQYYNRNNISSNLDGVIIHGKSYMEPVLCSPALTVDIRTKYTFTDNFYVSFDSLSRDFQKLILLCDIEGYSYGQIADYFGCPVGTIRTKLYRCRKFMTKIYRRNYRWGQLY